MDHPGILERAQTNPEQLPYPSPTPSASTSPVRRQSFRRSRSAPGTDLRQVITAHFLDDYGAHHYNPDHHSDHGDSEPASPINGDEEKTDSGLLNAVATGGSSSLEEPDLERGRSQLTREKSSRSRRSAKDPFLVRYIYAG